MKKELDKLDVDLNFMSLAIKIFKLIEVRLEENISVTDLNKLARLALVVQKSVKSIKIPKTDRTMMRNMNSVAQMIDALEKLQKRID
tara:strand:+ start:87 stop:347 length:261 start_codon:yes stop_codon:yes gene_type:complete